MNAIVPPGPSNPPSPPSASDLDQFAEQDLPFAAALRNIVVIGASAGGVAALRQLVGHLPADYTGAVFVVMHVSAGARSELAGILSRAGPLPAVLAEDGMRIAHGRIHTSAPDHHLLLERGRMRVVQGPRENRHRPAIDPLFRSAAWALRAARRRRRADRQPRRRHLGYVGGQDLRRHDHRARAGRGRVP